MNKIPDPSIEFADHKEISAMQSEKLHSLLEYVNEKSVFYKRSFKEKGIDVAKWAGLENLSSLPFTTKEEFAKQNPDLLCVPLDQVAEYVTTSGTLGEPVSYFLTEKDLDRLAYNEAISMQCSGAGPEDIFMLMTTMDKRFLAGLAYYLGTQKLGCGIIRNGPGVPHLQWESIKRFKPTYLIAVPSFIPKLIEHALANGIDPNKTSVKGIICIGEPIRENSLALNELGKRIVQQWNVSLFSTYASTEMAAAFTECEHHCGGHLHPELLILEVLDDNDEPVKNGAAGEVILTTLGVEALPLIRYRTGDICTLHTDVCKCGRSTPRLGPVIGRKEQMIKFKGTTLFPPLIFNILDQFEEVLDYVVELSANEFGNDHIRVFLTNELDHFDFVYKVKEAFKGRLRVTPEISFLPTLELNEMKHPESSRKPIKFKDIRN